jgi:hypothetical protein
MNAAPLALKHAPDRMPAYRRGSPGDEPVRIRHRTDSSGSELTDKMPVLRHDWHCHYRQTSEYSLHDIQQKYRDAFACDLSDSGGPDPDLRIRLRFFVGSDSAPGGHFHPNRTIDILSVLADMHLVRQFAAGRIRPVADRNGPVLWRACRAVPAAALHNGITVWQRPAVFRRLSSARTEFSDLQHIDNSNFIRRIFYRPDKCLHHLVDGD